jgi:hypothetical protein
MGSCGRQGQDDLRIWNSPRCSYGWYGNSYAGKLEIGRGTNTDGIFAKRTLHQNLLTTVYKWNDNSIKKEERTIPCFLWMVVAIITHHHYHHHHRVPE